MWNHRWQALGFLFGAAVLAGCGGSNPQVQAPPTQPPPTQGPAAYVYVLGVSPISGTGSIFEYAIGSDNALQPLSVPTVPAAIGAAQIVTDSSGLYVYVLNLPDTSTPSGLPPAPTISQFRVGPTGQLTALAPADVQIPVQFPVEQPVYLTADPQGQFLYAALTPDYYILLGPGAPTPPPPVIMQFAIAADGTLTPVSGGSVSTTQFRGPLVIDSTGSHAYLPNLASVAQFALGSGGQLSALQLGYAAIPDTQINGWFALSPNGQWAYVAAYPCGAGSEPPCGPLSLYQCTVNPDGTLTSTAEPIVSISNLSLWQAVFSSDSSSAYVLATGEMSLSTGINQIGEILQFTVDSSGRFSPASPAPVELGPNGGVSEVSRGNDLFVLVEPAPGCLPQCTPTGAVVVHEVIQANGQLQTTNTSAVAPGYSVVGMIVAPAN